MEGVQQSGIENVALSSAEADDAMKSLSSESTVVGVGLDPGTKGLSGERGVRGEVISGAVELLVAETSVLASVISYQIKRNTDVRTRACTYTHTHTHSHAVYIKGYQMVTEPIGKYVHAQWLEVIAH